MFWLRFKGVTCRNFSGFKNSSKAIWGQHNLDKPGTKWPCQLIGVCQHWKLRRRVTTGSRALKWLSSEHKKRQTPIWRQGLQYGGDLQRPCLRLQGPEDRKGQEAEERKSYISSGWNQTWLWKEQPRLFSMSVFHCEQTRWLSSSDFGKREKLEFRRCMLVFFWLFTMRTSVKYSKMLGSTSNPTTDYLTPLQ